MMMAFSVDDIERAHRDHKLAALLGIEGGHSIENDVRLLRDFYRLAVRYMTLGWTNTNEWPDSSANISNPKIKRPTGPTDGAKQIVLAMNRLCRRVATASVPTKTFYATPALTKGPGI